MTVVWPGRSILFLLAVFTLTSGIAQTDYCVKPKKKARKYYEAAERVGFRGEKSYVSLRKAVMEDEEFADAYLQLAYWNERQYKNLGGYQSVGKGAANHRNRMIDYFEKAIEYCPEIENYRILYVLGEHYYLEKDYATAKAYLNDYISNRQGYKTDQLRDRAEFFITVIDDYLDLMSNPVDFNPVKVGGVSTDRDEFLPSLSPDNKYMFFTRKQMVDTRTFKGYEEREVFNRSKNNYDGSFTEGMPMDAPFNRGLDQGGSSVSVDNKMIFVTAIQMVPKKFNGKTTLYAMGDIYYTEFIDGSWTELKSVGPEVNQRDLWEGQPSISADNKTLFFSRAINKVIPGEHYGLMDIYKATRLEDGTWGHVKNLGPTINTSGNEKSPFMHSDSYTLYFSSDAHVGVGGFDIYYSKLNKEDEFEKPKNIGYPINSEEDEHGFIVSTDGKFGYFASLMDEESLDIYRFELYEQARPEKVVFVKGETISGKEAIDGLEIKLKNVVTNKEVDAVLDQNTGEYVGVIAVKEDEDVLMTAKKDGYAFTSQYISSNETVVGKPVKADMEVKKIQKGETYRINNINFATNSYELNNVITSILDEFGAYLIRNPGLAVELHGHTDDVGDRDKNQILSENRAKAVYEYLIQAGVEASRLSFKGYGPSKPVASNDSEEGRALNRRTEFLVIAD